MPPIPDLRFENSFLSKLHPFVQFRRAEGDGKAEVIEIQWGHVFWVTMRDQVLSPLVQGTLFAILGFYFSPLSSRLGRKLKKSRKEGLGVGWLRGWIQNLGLSTTTSASTPRR
ncbi:hypothetical protein PM082_007660 [Marasmius tenuissimus]|nr:hypothetical protein PM082_007660 [Marasmius tenuissimus]